MSGARAELARDAARACLGRPRVAAAEIFVKESRHRRLIRGGAEASCTEAVESGMAVRLFRSDGRAGHAYRATVDDAGALDAAAGEAARLAERCAPGTAPFPPGEWEPPDLDLYDPAVEQAAAVEGLLARIETSIREEGRGEVRLESMLCVAGSNEITMATSGGFLGAYRTSLVTLVLALRARRGDEAVFDRSVTAVRHLAALDADRLGREAVRRARQPLGGGTLPPGPVRVALEPRVACVLVEHLARSLVDGAFERGRSALGAARPGDRVGSEALTLVMHRMMPRWWLTSWVRQATCVRRRSYAARRC